MCVCVCVCVCAPLPLVGFTLLAKEIMVATRVSLGSSNELSSRLPLSGYM